MRAHSCVLILATMLAVTPLVASAEPVNLIPNASFEESVDGQPTGWKTHAWSGKPTFAHTDLGRTGKRCVSVSSDDGADAAWTVTVPVKLQAVYRLSGWIKTENVQLVGGRPARGALLNIHNIQPLATRAVLGDHDWTQAELLVETGANDEIQINCLLGGWGNATGRALFDDLSLELISREQWKPDVTIDATQQGEPVSKYIYGQFIEHLGRCIYGGIWAEMLEDRKFHDAIGSKGSPWTILGEPESVTMVREDSFVGEQTPRLNANSTLQRGIAQSGLGLVADKEYVGHVWLKGTLCKAVHVSLVWGEGADGRQTETVLFPGASSEYTRHPIEFTARADTDDGRLEIVCRDKSSVSIGTVSLMPADNVRGMRADTLVLLEELDAPVYRWPGGNFVSGYDWRDGTGPRDRRPPRKNPAWQGIEHNDFGLDEFIAFCRELDTEPYIAVNSGLGQVAEAVAELEYANGSADTPEGRRRAEGGHPEPYAVKWWGIGNEMYGGWQLGHIPLEKYIEKHNTYAVAMRAKDPSIKLVAVGASGPWSEGMMQHSAEHMDLVSEHFYRHERPGLASHVAQIPEAVRAKAEAHRDYRRRFKSLSGKDIDIALDEWNYWYGPHVYGELGTRYFLKDALGVAAGLHEYTRQSDIMFMANYAQTVNVIGCIKTTKTHAAFATTGLVLKLYRQHYGIVPLAVTAPVPLDVAAALSADGKTLTIGVVNPTMEPVTMPLSITGLSLTGTGVCRRIAGDDPGAYNEPGKPPKVKIEEEPVTGITDELTVPACSVTIFSLDLD